MREEERLRLLQEMRQLSFEHENALYNKAGGDSFAVQRHLEEAPQSRHGLFLLIVCCLLLWVVYDLTEGNTIITCMQSLSSNPQIREVYDRIYHSNFIDWLVEVFS